MADTDPHSRIAGALGVLGVSRIVIVDDEFRPAGPTWEEFLAATEAGLGGARAQEVVVVLGLPDLPIGEATRPVRESRLRDAWERISQGEQSRLLMELALLSGEFRHCPSEQPDQNMLLSFLPTAMAILLHPEDWRSRSEELIAATDDGALLCLFDLDLGGSGGYLDERGMGLLGDALRRSSPRTVFAGILTNHATLDNEVARTSNLGQSHDLQLEKFLVLSKKRLLDGTGASLADGIVMLAMNCARNRLASAVLSLNNSANEDARRRLQNTTLQSFCTMVVARSEYEGVWEAETLFRLHRIAARVSFEAALSQKHDHLNEAIAQLRELRGRYEEPADASDRSEAARFQQDEWYQKADALNRSHAPLELGDVFRAGEQEYVVVAPRCDLQLRKNGTRNAYCIDLCRIEQNSPKQDQKHLWFELPHYWGVKKNGWVDLRRKQVIQIRSEVLDLASAKENGECVCDEAIPSGLHCSAHSRLKAVGRLFARLRGPAQLIEDAAAACEAEQSAELKKCVAMLFTGTSTDGFTAELTETGVRFNLKRRARIRSPFADHLLMQFASVLTRPAAEFPLE